MSETLSSAFLYRCLCLAGVVLQDLMDWPAVRLEQRAGISMLRRGENGEERIIIIGGKMELKVSRGARDH